MTAEQQKLQAHEALPGVEAPCSRPTAERLAAILSELARELHPERQAALEVRPESQLDRDLGIDSLARAELVLRLERSFGVHLAEGEVIEAETPGELLRVLQEAAPGEAAEAAWSTPRPEAVEAIPTRARTLSEALAFHAAAHPERAHIHLLHSEGGPQTLTYGDLWRGAQGLAAGLRERGLEPGSCVGLMLPTGADFFHAFCGVLLAGGVPVPIYPPARRSQIAEHLQRQARILANARARFLITTAEARPFGRLIRAQAPDLELLLEAAEITFPGAPEIAPQVDAQSLGLVQYTSGSTGDPKGVTLTNANLLANIRALCRALEVTSRDVVVSWLPLYHDMGLIGNWLGSLCFACPFVVMPPLTFLARPARWLWAIHNHGGTLSAAPNFAYELAARRIRDQDVAGLDLSSWRMAGNGAERVSRATIAAFSERFAPYGFAAEAMTPMYGLAESAVALTTTPLGRGPRSQRVERAALAARARAVAASDDDPHAVDLVSCGMPLPGHEVRVVDAAGRELADREVGRIQFRGPSATPGYLRAPEKTAALIEAGWHNSGDNGYVDQGELYVTGRIKDIIIRAGRNLYPEELEEAVGDLPGIRKGRVAVFPSEDPQTGSERLIVLAETRQRDEESRRRIVEAVAGRVTDLTDIPPDDVVLAGPGTVLKTANGKIRRAACRALYEGHGIDRPRPALWRQTLGLATTSILPLLRRWLHEAAALLYAGYFQAVYRLLAPPVFLGVLLLPGLAARRRLLRRAARVMLRLLGLTPEVRGLETLAEERPAVLVANHASYLDSLLLAAVLPPRFAFVAKRELAAGPVAGRFLGAIGTAFVERVDPAAGLEDTRRLHDSLGGGQGLIIYPEGTFDRRPGLRAFHMGAFVVAAERGAAVIPLGISGSRAVLRGDSNFARHGPLALAIGPPIAPEGSDWSAALALRNRARAAVLGLCNEPDLIGEPTVL